MEIYIKTETGLKLLGSTPPLEDFEEILNKVIYLENRINQIQSLLDQQH